MGSQVRLRSSRHRFPQGKRRKRAVWEVLAQDAASIVTRGESALLAFWQSWCWPASRRSGVHNAFSLHQPRLSACRREEKGATAVEYGIMVALIAVVIIVAVTLLGSTLADMFGQDCL